MPRPPADNLQAAVSELQLQGIDKLVCLLEVDESQSLGLTHERSVCEAAGINFERLAIPDFGVPLFTELYSLVERLTEDLATGHNIVVHCRGGIGRTGLICCCIAITAGMDTSGAIEFVTAQRNCTVPETDMQLAMIDQFATHWRASSNTDV